METGSDTMHDAGSTVWSWLISGSLVGFGRDIMVSDDPAEFDGIMESWKVLFYCKTCSITLNGIITIGQIRQATGRISPFSQLTAGVCVSSFVCLRGRY